jgi:hypothetical protein
MYSHLNQDTWNTTSFWLIEDMRFTCPWPCLVQMTFVDYQIRLSPGWNNLQFTPNPVASYKPENSVVLRFIVSLRLYQMFQKATKTLAPLLFMIDSGKMSALCDMFCINNATFWFEYSKTTYIKNVTRRHHNVSTCILQSRYIKGHDDRNYTTWHSNTTMPYILLAYCTSSSVCYCY